MISLILLTALLASGTKATPVSRQDNQAIINSQPIGYDPDFVRVLSDDDIVPEIRYIDFQDLSFNETLSALEPFIPGDEADADVDKRYINGADDRYLYSSTAYPFSTVGKLYWSNGVFCSGALVGPRHVLTAKHCLVSGASGTFAPSFDNGPAKSLLPSPQTLNGALLVAGRVTGRF
jgi:V8-like Glu-specific endopeptidase